MVRFRVRETGEERWSAVKATPIRDHDGRVAMAINVIEDITSHKRAERSQRFLSESTAVLSSSLDPEQVLGQVAVLAVPAVADWLFIDLVGELGVERVAVQHSDPELVARAEALHRSSPPDRRALGGVRNVLRTGRSELHSDLPGELAEAADRTTHFRLAREFRMRSAIVVPMIARGRTLGALTLASDGDGRRFDQSDLELAEELARRCAIAIDNARLFSERAYIARTLQQSLLPSELPDIPGIEAAARFRPIGEGNEVGGDFYDLFETGERGWTVVMGDVCGKGPDAAAVTALARYTLRAAAMRDRLPSRSLRLLNEALLAPARGSPLLHGGLRLPGDRGRRRTHGLCQRRPSAAPARAPGRPGGAGGRAGHAARGAARPALRGPLDVARPRRRARVLHRRGDRGPGRQRAHRRDHPGGAAHRLRRRRARTPSPPAWRRRHWPDPTAGRATTSPCSYSAWLAETTRSSTPMLRLASTWVHRRQVGSLTSP